MEQHGSPIEARRFGRYLRRIREGRRLSLDAVEELSSGYAERVTKSHLSRIENGLAEPSFRKMFALSQIYGMPLTVLAERLELDLQQEALERPPENLTYEEIDQQIDQQMKVGHTLKALGILVGAIDLLEQERDPNDKESAGWCTRWRVRAIGCLLKLERFELAKIEAERVLGGNLEPEDRLFALQVFVISCYRLGRFSVAQMGIETAERELAAVETSDRMRADFLVIRANISAVVGDLESAAKTLRRALSIYEEIPHRFEACKTRVNLAGAMISASRFSAARAQLEAAILVAESSGYERLHALALSHMAKLSYLTEDFEGCEAWAIRSNTLARAREFASVVFRNCYYLWKVAIARGDLTAARLNERTLRSLSAKMSDSLEELEEFRGAVGGGDS